MAGTLANKWGSQPLHMLHHRPSQPPQPPHTLALLHLQLPLALVQPPRTRPPLKPTQHLPPKTSPVIRPLHQHTQLQPRASQAIHLLHLPIQLQPRPTLPRHRTRHPHHPSRSMPRPRGPVHPLPPHSPTFPQLQLASKHQLPQHQHTPSSFKLHLNQLQLQL